MVQKSERHDDTSRRLLPPHDSTGGRPASAAGPHGAVVRPAAAGPDAPAPASEDAADVDLTGIQQFGAW